MRMNGDMLDSIRNNGLCCRQTGFSPASEHTPKPNFTVLPSLLPLSLSLSPACTQLKQLKAPQTPGKAQSIHNYQVHLGIVHLKMHIHADQ